MARPSTDYAPRSPDAAVLYQVVRDHLEIFLAQAASLRLLALIDQAAAVGCILRDMSGRFG
jgi:hypothetical protein